ncbi:N-acetylglucosamine-6-phosphate deacetylase [Thalassospira lucentensis]|uniref:N-acetylglucosamine-6-phosphate deacetylase n=1 Tax=Thalassospira lucentensis TaxID=168935 RepID=UPI003D2F3302
MTAFAITNARIFDSTEFLEGKAVVVRDGKIDVICDAKSLPADLDVIDGKGQTLAPGLIDVQVNGGGGVLLNDQPNIDGIRAIMTAHRKFGTTAMLPTLITDHRDKMEAAIEAVQGAIDYGVPGIVGIHLEGPYLNVERKGVHSADIIRPMEDDALELLTRLPNGRILVTMAPEKAAKGTIKALADQGVLVCAGHTAGSYDDIQHAIGEGMRGFTHLFNAMSPLTHREPGVAGAAMSDDRTWCGLIVDGYHVHPAAVKIAVKAKATGKIMLVTDAMPTVGADDKRFMLGNEEIIAMDGRCALADGTLAGSDLDMISAVKNCVEMVGIELGEALRMASLYPAAFLKLDHMMGRIVPGYQADLILIDDAFNVTKSWINGIE